LEKQEVTMQFKRVLMITILLLAAVLWSSPGFTQDKGEKVITFSGLIQAVPKDSSFIVINEAKVFLMGAKIVSDTGSTLSISDLKPKLYVTVEAVKTSDGFSARKVTVNSSSKIPKNLKNAF
jgi:hypothetical protein